MSGTITYPAPGRSILALLLLSVLLASAAGGQRAMAQQPDLDSIQVTRLLDQPLIAPGMHPSIGANIQGPSVIRLPDWVPDRLGNYYMYFADHKGDYIRLAYADAITGPWQIYAPGTLQLAESFFLVAPPEVSDARVQELDEDRRLRGVRYPHDMRTELTSTHIASPDVHVDDRNQRIIMYYHGPAISRTDAAGEPITQRFPTLGGQRRFVATSADGIHFTSATEILGSSYFRVFSWQGITYALGMPGIFYRSQDGFTNFEQGPILFNANMRHSALHQRGHLLDVYYTEAGDCPEHIKMATIDLRPAWLAWQPSAPVSVLFPEESYEGGDLPLAPSERGSIHERVCQLRDPGIFTEEGRTYLLYSVAGEAGLAMANINP